MAQQAHQVFVPIIGYSYGRKKESSRGKPRVYSELAGQDFWYELTGDSEFYLKIIRHMGALPEKYVEDLETAYQSACNRLVREFTVRFCNEDGSIDWESLVRYNSSSTKEARHLSVPSPLHE